ncbi:hypothetical protein Tco_1115875 [Tanacetum coccineum]
MFASFGSTLLLVLSPFRGILAKACRRTLFLRISRNYTLDEDTYPQFLRDNDEGEPKLLDTTVGRVVSLLPVAPARSLMRRAREEANQAWMLWILFDERKEIEGGAPVQFKGVKETGRITIVSDAGGPSHPPKKLMEDHETSTGLSVAGKSMSALQRLLAGAVLNPKVGIAALPTLPL